MADQTFALLVVLGLSPRGAEIPVVKAVLALAIPVHCAWIGWVGMCGPGIMKTFR
jgi:hypothetical protein